MFFQIHNWMFLIEKYDAAYDNSILFLVFYKLAIIDITVLNENSGKCWGLFYKVTGDDDSPVIALIKSSWIYWLSFLIPWNWPEDSYNGERNRWALLLQCTGKYNLPMWRRNLSVSDGNHSLQNHSYALCLIGVRVCDLKSISIVF